MRCHGSKYIIFLTSITSIILIILACKREPTTVPDEHRQYPFIVLLYIDDGNEEWTCVGTLIDRRRILTAAHCLLNASLINLTLSADSLKEGSPNSYQLNGSRSFIHEDYDNDTRENDIALIYLYEDTPINEDIKSVSLPREGAFRDKDNTALVVLGWKLNSIDYEDHLLVKKVTKRDMSECRNAGQLGQNHTFNKICAGGIDLVKPCTGDSGAPLLSGNVQIGVLSSGPENCTGLNLYTRLEDYMVWIDGHVQLPEKETNVLSQMKHYQGDPMIVIIMIIMIIINMNILD